jgi:hypothetical protein
MAVKVFDIAKQCSFIPSTNIAAWLVFEADREVT